MAEDSLGQRKETKAPWTKIFTGFKVALDIKKLLLAAGGIFAMAAGWYVLAIIFFNMRGLPQPDDYVKKDGTEEQQKAGWDEFKIARGRYNLLYEMAGSAPTDKLGYEDAADIAINNNKSFQEYIDLQKKVDGSVAPKILKPHGRLRTWPWFEERGPNQYLLATSLIKQSGTESDRNLPWARGQFVSWFVGNQLPVLFEPLVKFFKPIVYFFDKDAGGWNRVYLIGVILWTLLVWGFFGGAITRMAAVQVARNEKVSMGEALRFARARLQSFFSAPLFPLLFLGGLTFVLILFGLFSGLIPILGDVVISGLLWPVVLLIALIMAVVLIGLLGWPLMNPTISTEGSDSFDALSRSYSYVFQAPWHYLWYTTVAMAYGAVLVFFVGLMGSLMVYLGEWGVSQAPFLASSNPASDREPTYLFVNAPTSYGWRNLLLHGSPFAEHKEIATPTGGVTKTYEMSQKYMETMKPWNYIGAYFVTFWLYLLFLLIVGFGYSYFWTASSIIYLLMRHKVDDTDLDEIHLEEEETEEPFAKDMAAPSTIIPTAPKPGPVGNVTMVESPTLRTPTPPVEAAAKDNIPKSDGPSPANP